MQKIRLPLWPTEIDREQLTDLIGYTQKYGVIEETFPVDDMIWEGASQDDVAKVVEAVAETLAGLGHRTAFGLLGQRQLQARPALRRRLRREARVGAQRVGGGRAADAYAQVTHGLGVATVHQGPA